MAEFALVQDGHSWNNAVAHATFADNSLAHGQERALELLREDIRSWIKERRGENHQWSLWVRDGQMVTQTGVSLQKMTHNITDGPHSDLVPESIKATAPFEAATLEAATRLAAAGADRIILPEQHLNEQGNVVARYLSVWTKDATNPTLYHGSRIDLGKNVRIEDVRTGTSFAAFQDGQTLSFHEHSEQKHAFVLAVQNNPKRPFEAVEKSITTTIHRSHQETYIRAVRSDAYAKEETIQRVPSEVQHARHDVFDKTKSVNAPDTQKAHDVDFSVQVPRAVARETADTVRDVAVFLRDKEKRDEGKTRLADVQPERLTIEKIREKPVRVGKEIEERHTEMQKSVAALLFAAETKVALGAAPLLLAALAKEYPKPIEAVKKSIRRHNKKELRRKNYELRKKAKREAKKGLTKVQSLKTERVEPLQAAKERKGRKKRRKVYMGVTAVTRIYTFEKQGRRERKIGVKKIAVAEKMTPMASEQPERRRRRRVRRAVEKSVRRHKKRELRRIARREAKKDSVRVEPFKERKQSIQRKEREAMAAIRFVWVLWIVLTRKDTETPKNNFKRSHPASQGETLRRQEETPWILLSIIYYLTALREQAMHNHPVAQIIPVQQTIPQYAVIYAFAS